MDGQRSDWKIQVEVEVEVLVDLMDDTTLLILLQSQSNTRFAREPYGSKGMMSL